jgi:hypothetical protein
MSTNEPLALKDFLDLADDIGMVVAEDDTPQGLVSFSVAEFEIYSHRLLEKHDSRRPIPPISNGDEYVVATTMARTVHDILVLRYGPDKSEWPETDDWVTDYFELTMKIGAYEIDSALRS